MRLTLVPILRRVPRVAGVVVAVAAVAGLGACSGDVASRRDVVDGYRRELVRQGVDDATATCVTDRFFAGLDDAQLRAFQKRDALTDDERAMFAAIGRDCGAGT